MSKPVSGGQAVLEAVRIKLPEIKVLPEVPKTGTGLVVGIAVAGMLATSWAIRKVWKYFNSSSPQEEEDGEEGKRKRVKVQTRAGSSPENPGGSNTETTHQNEDDEDKKKNRDLKSAEDQQQTNQHDNEKVKYLYHYTTGDGKDGILKDNRINMSTDSSGRDAFFGDGVYLTTIPPEAGRLAVMHNNYDSTAFYAGRRIKMVNFGQKVNWYFKFRIQDLPGVRDVSYVHKKTKKNIDVWLFPDDIEFDKYKLDGYGETPD